MIKLSQEQKDLILESFQKDPNILNITRIVFNDDKIDGRSKEGRAVTKYLAENGFKTKTTKRKKAEEIELSEEQLDKIEELKGDGLNTSEIADIIFGGKTTRLSKPWRVINDIVNQKKEKKKKKEVKTPLVITFLLKLFLGSLKKSMILQVMDWKKIKCRAIKKLVVTNCVSILVIHDLLLS